MQVASSVLARSSKLEALRSGRGSVSFYMYEHLDRRTFFLRVDIKHALETWSSLMNSVTVSSLLSVYHDYPPVTAPGGRGCVSFFVGYIIVSY